MESEESTYTENQTVYDVSSLVEQILEIENTDSNNQLKQDQAKSEYSLDFETEVDDGERLSSTSVKELDHWSKWLLRKEMERRERKFNETVQKQREICELNKTNEQKQLKIKMATDNWKSQLLVKMKEQKERNVRFKKQLKENKALKEQKKLEIQQHCSEEYKIWLSKKAEKIKENKLKLQREMEESKLNCERIKQINSKAYDQWLLQSTGNPLPETRSYGISAGKLICKLYFVFIS